MQLAAKTLDHPLKELLFEDEYRGAEGWAKLQGYIGEPLIRSTVDALNDGRKITC